MLNNRLGVFLYLILPHYISWGMLSEKEKKSICDGTIFHNLKQYEIPEAYDNDHKRSLPAEETREGKIINFVLKKYSPVSVLEIGPGSGFYIKLFLENKNIKEYAAIDIVKGFLDYIKKMIPQKNSQPRIDLICADILKYDFEREFDLIIFNSSLHHIPYRVEVLNKCASLLAKKGVIVFIEPRHGIPRLTQIIKKFLFSNRKKNYWLNKNNLSTHHFLTVSELRHIERKCKLEVCDLFFFAIKGERYSGKLFRRELGFPYTKNIFPLSWFAHQVFTVLKKESTLDN